jgi:predicted  nucleic acid-binding Zn ribbon protein
MTNKDRNIIKNKILKCLTEDFKNNQALFNKKEGYQVFYGTNLNMIMNAVVKGLELAKIELPEPSEL